MIEQAIKTGKGIRPGVDAADVVALGWGKLYADSLDKNEGKLQERLRIVESVSRVIFPGLMVDERQRAPMMQPGLTVSMSEDVAERLLGRLPVRIADSSVVEGESREVDSEEE